MAIYTKPDSYTKLLIHSDDPDGSTFIDSSPSRHTVTRGGDTYHKATKKKFGSSSMEFDGSDDKLTIADHSDFDFGTGDFTIDFWFNTTVANQQYTSFVAAEPNNGITILLNTGSASDGKIGLWGAVGNPITSVGGWNDGVWHHCAAVRNGGDLDIYVDGISYVTVTPSAAQNHQNPWIIGDSYYGSRVYTGYIDEFRISTIARWTSNFTPPNKPYDIINTDTQTSDSKEDSAFEVTGGGNAQFGSSIVTRSDPGEASLDSLFSVNKKDGTPVINVTNDIQLSAMNRPFSPCGLGSIIYQERILFENDAGNGSFELDGTSAPNGVALRYIDLNVNNGLCMIYIYGGLLTDAIHYAKIICGFRHDYSGLFYNVIEQGNAMTTTLTAAQTFTFGMAAAGSGDDESKVQIDLTQTQAPEASSAGVYDHNFFVTVYKTIDAGYNR